MTYTLSLLPSFFPQNWSKRVLAFSKTSAATEACAVGDTIEVSTPPWLFCVASVGLKLSCCVIRVAISKVGSSMHTWVVPGTRLASGATGDGCVSEPDEPPPLITGFAISKTFISSIGVRFGGLVGVLAACFKLVTVVLGDMSMDFGGSDLVGWCTEASSENVFVFNCTPLNEKQKRTGRIRSET